MRMFIPSIGFTFRLTSDWGFNLYKEYRNENVLSRLPRARPYSSRSSLPDKDGRYGWEITFPSEDWYINEYRQDAGTVLQYTHAEYGKWYEAEKSISFLSILPKDSVLKVDRFHLDADAEYDSVSFIIKESTGIFDPKAKIPGERGALRFWAKLDDVNRINFECE